jgi:hypothetical protein
VLATVVATVSASRTQLYRMEITKFLAEVKEDFEVLGERNDD